MIAIISEDAKGVGTIKAFVRQVIGSEARVKLRGKGLGGYPNLLKEAARVAKAYCDEGARVLVICADADGNDGSRRLTEVEGAVAGAIASGVRACISIAVQEIESWLIADEAAVRRVNHNYKSKAIPNPEAVLRPKEHLVRCCKDAGGKSSYIPELHNEQVASEVNLATLETLCPSFKRFSDCLRASVGACL